jgi:hypothetical protein
MNLLASPGTSRSLRRDCHSVSHSAWTGERTKDVGRAGTLSDAETGHDMIKNFLERRVRWAIKIAGDHGVVAAVGRTGASYDRTHAAISAGAQRRRRRRESWA